METDHDIDALVSLTTDHEKHFGDSIHHALGAEVKRLREINSELSKAVQAFLEAIDKGAPGQTFTAQQLGRAAIAKAKEVA